MARLKARIPGFPPKLLREGASSLLGQELESPRKLFAPSLIDGESRNSGLVQGNRDPYNICGLQRAEAVT